MEATREKESLVMEQPADVFTGTQQAHDPRCPTQMSGIAMPCSERVNLWTSGQRRRRARSLRTWISGGAGLRLHFTGADKGPILVGWDANETRQRIDSFLASGPDEG
ncbi:hypothetical protein LEL_09526 [Akanthomyces lecanii RCEF 1005]|uniref:Uncharacterized protein n=1 Tax=Akanthomyces lecanii RCEF 1005 TaxID=1081108 RepID=A0A168C4T3_CORDF|nr:hypothetical protein LEL_09526 [Akanthomyces lecanii RCEF 1005]